jgi:hypothetical protein
MTFADLARRASKFAVDNSPTILTSFGVVGAITTAYLTGRASFEAADLIRLKEGVEGTIDDPKERLKSRVQLVWKLYIPAATTGVASVACIIGANHVGSRRAAGLAAAYSITEKTFDEYKKKVVEKIGERKEEQIHDEIAQDRVKAAWRDGVEIYGAEVGELCYDKFSDRFFRGTVESIRAAQNDFNHALIHDGYASLAELYRFLDMPTPAFSESIGWNSDRLLDIKISSVLTPLSVPAISMEFRHEPLPDYGRFR